MRLKKDVSVYMAWWLRFSESSPRQPVNDFFREKRLVGRESVGYKCSHSLTSFDWLKNPNYTFKSYYFEKRNTVRIDAFVRIKSYDKRWDQYHEEGLRFLQSFWINLQNRELTQIDNLPNKVWEDDDSCYTIYQLFWSFDDDQL